MAESAGFREAAMEDLMAAAWSDGSEEEDLVRELLDDGPPLTKSFGNVKISKKFAATLSSRWVISLCCKQVYPFLITRSNSWHHY